MSVLTPAVLCRWEEKTDNNILYLLQWRSSVLQLMSLWLSIGLSKYCTYLNVLFNFMILIYYHYKMKVAKQDASELMYDE